MGLKHKLALLLSCLSSLASGEHIVGNGGNIIVCINQSGDLITAESVDLYLRDFDPMDSEGLTKSPEELAQTVMAKVESIDKEIAQSWNNNLERVIRSRIYVSEDLKTPADTGGIDLILPNQCHLKAAILAITGRDRIDYYFNSYLWQSLNTEDQTALLLHEAIYSHARTLGHLNSRPTRRVVDLLMSKQLSEISRNAFENFLRTQYLESEEGEIAPPSEDAIQRGEYDPERDEWQTPFTIN